MRVVRDMGSANVGSRKCRIAKRESRDAGKAKTMSRFGTLLDSEKCDPAMP